MAAVCESSSSSTPSPILDIFSFKNFGYSSVRAVFSHSGFILHLPEGL